MRTTSDGSGEKLTRHFPRRPRSYTDTGSSESEAALREDSRESTRKMCTNLRPRPERQRSGSY